MLCRELNGGADAKLYVRVRLLSGGEALVRHGALAAVKQIDVDVEWGPSTARRRLNSLGASGMSFNIPVTVYKCELDRGL